MAFHPSRIPVAHLLAAALSAGLSLVAIVAQAGEEHEFDVVFSEQLSLHSAFETSASRHPDAGLPAAMRNRADAEQRFADRWIPDSPTLTGYHLSDRVLDDRGLYEDEVALNLPLWMPGEKRSRTGLAEHASALADAGAAEFSWQVAGEFRQALWTLIEARRSWELAGAQVRNLSDVLEQATLYEEVGDISRGDLLAVVQELAGLKAELLARDAEYRDAARTWRALTGMTVAPADHREVRSEATEITDTHPALSLARGRVAVASARLESLRQGNPIRPVVQVFWRVNRPDDYSPSDNALGLGFEVPLGHSPMRGPDVAEAEEALAGVEADLLKRQRELALQLHEAEHNLETLARQLEVSRERMQAADARLEMDRLALELGEISMQEWLRRLAAYREYEWSHEMLILRQDAAVAAYNQAVGETP